MNHINKKLTIDSKGKRMLRAIEMRYKVKAGPELFELKHRTPNRKRKIIQKKKKRRETLEIINKELGLPENMTTIQQLLHHMKLQNKENENNDLLIDVLEQSKSVQPMQKKVTKLPPTRLKTPRKKKTNLVLS